MIVRQAKSGKLTLLLMSQCKQIQLMGHDFCIYLRKTKFRQFSVYLFSIFFLIFLGFLSLYTVIVLRSTHPQYFYDLYNKSGNASGNIEWDYGLNSELCHNVSLFVSWSNDPQGSRNVLYDKATLALYVFLLVLIIKDVLLIFAQVPRLFRKLSYYLEISALVLSFLWLYDWYPWQKAVSMRCPIQWQLVSLLVSR
jgi:hypothetical protein